MANSAKNSGLYDNPNTQTQTDKMTTISNSTGCDLVKPNMQIIQNQSFLDIHYKVEIIQNQSFQNHHPFPK